jgi:hypothetical protein
MNEDETREAMGKLRQVRLIMQMKMKMEMAMSVKASWKVMRFGLAWFWRLLVHSYHSSQIMRHFEHKPPG